MNYTNKWYGNVCKYYQSIIYVYNMYLLIRIFSYSFAFIVN